MIATIFTLTVLANINILNAKNFGSYTPTAYMPSARQVYLPTKIFRSSFPFITGSTFRRYADHIMDACTIFKPEKVKRGDLIFVQIDFLDDFIKIHRPKIKHPYLLLIHHFFGESDDPVPGPYGYLLEDPLLVACFAHNADRIHKKLYPLPIGIADFYYTYGNTDIFRQKINIPYKHSRLALMCCSLHTCPEERKPVLEFFKNKPFCNIVQANLPLNDYLDLVGDHKFILSPRGHGLDCFRTWESLLLKSFPIVISSTLDPLFEDLPVVIVKNWEEVTEEFLEKKYLQLTSHKHYKWEKLYMPYWLKKIKDKQREARKWKCS